MAVTLAMLTVDGVHRLLHLLGIRWGIGTEHALHHQLFGAGLATKRRLQARGVAQALVNLNQAICTNQDSDKAIIHFLNQCVLRDFLLNLDLFLDRPKQVELSHPQSDHRECGTRRESALDWLGGRVIHGDEPPVFGIGFPARYGSSLPLWKARFASQHIVPYSGKT